MPRRPKCRWPSGVGQTRIKTMTTFDYDYQFDIENEKVAEGQIEIKINIECNSHRLEPLLEQRIGAGKAHSLSCSDLPCDAQSGCFWR